MGSGEGGVHEVSFDDRRSKKVGLNGGESVQFGTAVLGLVAMLAVSFERLPFVASHISLSSETTKRNRVSKGAEFGQGSVKGS